MFGFEMRFALLLNRRVLTRGFPGANVARFFSARRGRAKMDFGGGEKRILSSQTPFWEDFSYFFADFFDT